MRRRCINPIVGMDQASSLNASDTASAVPRGQIGGLGTSDNHVISTGLCRLGGVDVCRSSIRLVLAERG